MDNALPDLISIDSIASHHAIWSRMQYILETKKIPQGLLFMGPEHAGVLSFVYRFIASVFCDETSAPCGQCGSCSRIIKNIHPDISEITFEATSRVIKIDQVRSLQHDVYQTPQCAKVRFILIHPADKMNRGAANALLKILEEPPSHIVFILIAEQTHTIPATILSRCQKFIFPPPECLNRPIDFEYLQICNYYAKTASRSQLFQIRHEFIQSIQDLIEGRIDVCRLAMAWKDYNLDDLLWFLYLLTASLILDTMRDVSQCTDSGLTSLVKTLNIRFIQPLHLFSQLDLLLTFMQKKQYNISLNPVLIIETFLLSYLESSHESIYRKTAAG